MRVGKERILAAAHRLYARGGVDRVSMRRVGRAVGVTPMAIYRHFRDRDDLLEALAADAFQRWEKRVTGISAREPLPWLRQVFQEYLDFAISDTRHFQAAFILTTRATRKFPDDFAAGKSPAGRMVLAQIERLAHRNQLRRSTNPLELIMTMWAQAHGLIVLFLGDRFSCDPHGFREIYTRSMETLLRGLQKRDRWETHS